MSAFDIDSCELFRDRKITRLINSVFISVPLLYGITIDFRCSRWIYEGSRNTIRGLLRDALRWSVELAVLMMRVRHLWGSIVKKYKREVQALRSR